MQDDSVFAALQVGARGCLPKGALRAEILRSIRAVVSGEAIFGPAIARRMMQFFAAPRPSTLPDAFPELTGREHEILELIAHHETNPEIANRLYLSPKTIRNHVSNISTKLQVADRLRPSSEPAKPGSEETRKSCSLKLDAVVCKEVRTILQTALTVREHLQGAVAARRTEDSSSRPGARAAEVEVLDRCAVARVAGDGAALEHLLG